MVNIYLPFTEKEVLKNLLLNLLIDFYVPKRVDKNND